MSLTRMQLNDFDNFAIRGNGGVNFTLTDRVVSGANGTTGSLPHRRPTARAASTSAARPRRG